MFVYRLGRALWGTMEHYTPLINPVMSVLCRAFIFNCHILDLHVSKVIANNVIIYLDYEIQMYGIYETVDGTLGLVQPTGGLKAGSNELATYQVNFTSLLACRS